MSDELSDEIARGIAGWRRRWGMIAVTINIRRMGDVFVRLGESAAGAAESLADLEDAWRESRDRRESCVFSLWRGP